MHDVLIVGLPMLMILAGILLNRADVKELRAEMKAEISGIRAELKDSKTGTSDQLGRMRSETADQLGRMRSETADQLGRMRSEAADRHAEVLARFNVLEADMRQFYHLTGKLEARMDAMEKR